MRRPLLRRPPRPGTALGKPVLQPLEREPARGVPYGSCTVWAPASENAGPVSVPRLERSTTRPASTQTRALNPSFCRL
ncbi:hypothetical protein [Streptomyces sp. NPDC093591]|uniref:hypothetical protein n=1 Tax=Streptomyces sp. NPDC093591 TaxID=3366044 RepID=UPI00382FFB07